MKRLKNKIHHFTKRELAAEEIIIIFLICFVMAVGSYAASVYLPIKTEILQCGAREDLPEMCQKDARCCALLNQSGGAESESMTTAPDYSEDIWGDETDIPEETDAEIYILPDTGEDVVVE